MSAGAASVLGFTVNRSGVDLFTRNVHLVVAESCSGMDSLLALLCLGALFVSLTQASIGRRLLLLTAVVPITLAANVVPGSLAYSQFIDRVKALLESQGMNSAAAASGLQPGEARQETRHLRERRRQARRGLASQPRHSYRHLPPDSPRRRPGR